jgi:hypothetical protein
MTTGERKIEIPHIQRNITLDQVLLSAGMFESSLSISISSIDIDRRAKVGVISPSWSPEAVSISDTASPAGNDIAMDHSEIILLPTVNVRLRDRSSRKCRSSPIFELQRRKKELEDPKVQTTEGRKEDVGDTILITARIIDLKSTG